MSFIFRDHFLINRFDFKRYLIIRPPGTVVYGKPYVLQQFFFHREISEVRGPISAKFCHMVGSMFSLQMPVQKFEGLPPKKFWAQKTRFLDSFSL